MRKIQSLNAIADHERSKIMKSPTIQQENVTTQDQEPKESDGEKNERINQ